MHKWHISKNFDEASQAAADFIVEKIRLSLQTRNICHIILPGGKTPAKCLSLVAQEDLPWEKIHWYLGDERCYPLGHAERNDVMLEDNLWSHLPIVNVHAMPAELGADVAANIYREVIRSIETFDIAFLGMGEDGHTASLFPGNKALTDLRSVVPVFDAPKEPKERVSLGLTTLKRAETKLILACGASKAEMLIKIKSGEKLPVNSIGDIDWFVDQLAVSDA